MCVYVYGGERASVRVSECVYVRVCVCDVSTPLPLIEAIHVLLLYVHSAQVRTWPPNIFSMAQLMESVAARMKRPGGESRELALIMAELYERQVQKKHRQGPALKLKI